MELVVEIFLGALLFGNMLGWPIVMAAGVIMEAKR
jgi:hypothetical protein